MDSEEWQPEAAVLEEAVRGSAPVPEQIDRPSARSGLVREAARRWRAQLIDLGGRNTLLYYRDLKAGTLDLGDADEVARTALLSGRPMTLRQLFPDRAVHKEAVKRARTIRNKARELLEERGIQSCFLAIGMATWSDQKVTGASVPAAPVLLQGAQLRARGAAEEDYELTVTGDVDLNPTLLHLLAEDFGVTVDADQLEELIDHTAGFDPTPVF